jgi:anaerobic selenocysteine-containing dehydrogenase
VDALGRSAEKPEWGKVILGQPEPSPPQRPAEIQTLANDLAGAGKVVIVTATSDPVAASLAALLAGALGGKAKVFILTDYGNASDIVKSQPGLRSVEEVLRKIDGGQVKNLLTLGVDLVSSYPGLPVEEKLGRLDHLIAGSSFPTETTRRAEIVLPTTLWIEEDAVRAGKRWQSAVPPPGAAQSYGKILASIAAAGGRELHAKSMEAAPPRKVPIRELCLELIEEARKEPAAPRVKSTETKFAGGWLTGYSDWVRARFARCRAPLH